MDQAFAEAEERLQLQDAEIEARGIELAGARAADRRPRAGRGAASASGWSSASASFAISAPSWPPRRRRRTPTWRRLTALMNELEEVRRTGARPGDADSAARPARRRRAERADRRAEQAPERHARAAARGPVGGDLADRRRAGRRGGRGGARLDQRARGARTRRPLRRPDRGRDRPARRTSPSWSGSRTRRSRSRPPPRSPSSASPEGRATLEMALTEPVELLRELEQRCDLEFRVRDLRADRVILDVGE